MRLIASLAFALALSGSALSQPVDFPTGTSGINARGGVMMCLDSSGNAKGASTSNPCPVSGVLAASSAIIGKVGIDQTTPGTTNAIAIDGAQISTTSSSALAANTVIKASAGQLYSFNVSATSTLYAAAWWIMIYNATSAPVDGAVTPAKCYAMPAGVTNYSAAFPNPVPFSTGIVIGVSTNGCFTKAASTQAFISGDYK